MIKALFHATITLVFVYSAIGCTKNLEQNKTLTSKKEQLESALTQTTGITIILVGATDKEAKQSYQTFNQFLSQPYSMDILQQAMKTIKSEEPSVNISLELSESAQHKIVKRKNQLILSLGTKQSVSSIREFILALNHNQFFFDLERKTKDCDFLIKAKSGPEKRKIALSLLPSSDLLNGLNCHKKDIRSITFHYKDNSPTKKNKHYLSESESTKKVHIFTSNGPESVKTFLAKLLCDPNSQNSSCPSNQNLSH